MPMCVHTHKQVGTRWVFQGDCLEGGLGRAGNVPEQSSQGVCLYSKLEVSLDSYPQLLGDDFSDGASF